MAISTVSESTTDRLFDFLIARQASLFGAVNAATERNHRFNGRLIENAHQLSIDWTEVGKRWAARPGDVLGLYEAMWGAIGNSQFRALALTREWLDDRIELQRENHEALQSGFGDVREIVQRAQANVPEFLRRGSDRSARHGSATSRSQRKK